MTTYNKLVANCKEKIKNKKNKRETQEKLHRFSVCHSSPSFLILEHVRRINTMKDTNKHQMWTKEGNFYLFVHSTENIYFKNIVTFICLLHEQRQQSYGTKIDINFTK